METYGQEQSEHRSATHQPESLVRFTAASEWTEDERLHVYEWYHETLHEELVALTQSLIRSYSRGAGWEHADDDLAEVARDLVCEKTAQLFVLSGGVRSYNPGRYRGKACPFRNWVRRIMIREATNWARREARHYGHGPRVLEADVPEVSDNMDRVDVEWRDIQDLKEWRWRDNSEWSDIEPLVERLGPLYREAMKLCHRWRLSYAEAARISRRPCKATAMKVRAHRAHRQLAPLLATRRFLETADAPVTVKQALTLTVLRGHSIYEAATIAGCDPTEMRQRAKEALQHFERWQAGAASNRYTRHH